MAQQLVELLARVNKTANCLAKLLFLQLDQPVFPCKKAFTIRHVFACCPLVLRMLRLLESKKK